ncbi:MAG: pilus assembly protein PilM [Planctomycetota bacterium]|nr:pilus assembly protein PilM [Planctomycetota bacterium]
MAKTVTGIDVGQRTVKFLRGHYKGNTFHVADFAIFDNPAAVGSDDWIAKGWAASIQAFKPGPARIGLTGKNVNVRYTRVPRVPDWQLRNLMRFEVSEVGDQSGTEVASDFNLLPEMPEIEGEDVVLLAMARESLLDAHLDGLDEVGGKLECFSPSAIALYNAWLRYGVVQDDTVLIANIGYDNLDVVIARGPDLLFARNLSGGGKLFDEAIASRMGVSADQAEKVKLKMASLAPGTSYQSPNHERASRAILGAAGQLLSLLQSAVLFCKSQVKVTGLKLDRVMICGGGSALEGLPQYLASGMNVPVERFDPFRVVNTDSLPPEIADELEKHKLQSVVALGLATMSTDPEAYDLEILPAAVVKRRAFLEGPAWLIAAAVVAVLFLLNKATTLSSEAATVRKEAQGLTAQVRRAQSTHSKAEKFTTSNATLSELVVEVEGLAGMGEQAARVLAQLDQHLPKDFWMTQMVGEVGSDTELGIQRNKERPILKVEGDIQEGIQSAVGQFNELTKRLRKELPGVELKGNPDRGWFIDLSLYGEHERVDAEEGE